jgi:hypothetical protein
MKSISFQNIHEAMLAARALTRSRLSEYPNYGVYQHANEQLTFIQSILESGVKPTEKEKKTINIGLMAVRELEAEEPDYAAVLIDVAARFDAL